MAAGVAHEGPAAGRIPGARALLLLLELRGSAGGGGGGGGPRLLPLVPRLAAPGGPRGPLPGAGLVRRARGGGCGGGGGEAARRRLTLLPPRSPRGFALDLARLRQRFLALQRSLHPDRFSRRPQVGAGRRSPAGAGLEDPRALDPATGRAGAVTPSVPCRPSAASRSSTPP